MNTGQKQGELLLKVLTKYYRGRVSLNTSAKIDSVSREGGRMCSSANRRDLQMLLTTEKWVTQSQRHKTEPSVNHMYIIYYSLFPLSLFNSSRLRVKTRSKVMPREKEGKIF